MANEYIIAAIGVGGTLLGTIAGFFSTLLYERIKEKSKLKSDIQAAINEVLLVQVVNEYPVALNKLRRLLVANAHTYLKNESVTGFFTKWLNNPVLYFDKPIANFISDEKIPELKADLMAIKL